MLLLQGITLSHSKSIHVMTYNIGDTFLVPYHEARVERITEKLDQLLRQASHTNDDYVFFFQEVFTWETYSKFHQLAKRHNFYVTQTPIEFPSSTILEVKYRPGLVIITNIVGYELLQTKNWQERSNREGTIVEYYEPWKKDQFGPFSDRLVGWASSAIGNQNRRGMLRLRLFNPDIGTFMDLIDLHMAYTEKPVYESQGVSHAHTTQLDQLLALVSTDHPAIIAGDFNLSGLMRWVIKRETPAVKFATFDSRSIERHTETEYNLVVSEDTKNRWDRFERNLTDRGYVQAFLPPGKDSFSLMNSLVSGPQSFIKTAMNYDLEIPFVGAIDHIFVHLKQRICSDKKRKNCTEVVRLCAPETARLMFTEEETLKEGGLFISSPLSDHYAVKTRVDYVH